MKKLIIGAGMVYIVRKLQEEGFLDELSNNMDNIANKAKKNFNKAFNKTKYEAENLKENIQNELQEYDDI